MKLIPKLQTGWQPINQQAVKEWSDNWKSRTTKSRVLQGRGVESDKQYTERRKRETAPQRTWLSNAADIAHGVRETALAMHPLTAIPYFGAKVGQDFLNGNVSWQTALNASIPIFHLSPQINGIMNKGKDIVQESMKKRSLGIASNKKVNLNPDNTWNMTKISEDITKGSKDAVDFLGSSIKAESDAHNLALAQRLGYKYFTPYYNAAKRASTPIKPDFKLTKPNETTLGSVSLDPTNPLGDQMSLNLYGDLEPATFHEQLHRGYYGMADGTAWNRKESLAQWGNRFNDTNKFYRWKTDKLLQERNADNFKWHDYLTDSGEGGANFMEVGKRMGIKPGTPYPGKEKATQMFQDFINGNDPKAGVIKTSKWNSKPKRVWNAITGKYYIIPSGLISLGGYNFLNNTFGQQNNYQ